MDIKGEVLLTTFQQKQVKNETRTILKPKFYSVFKKLWFIAPLKPFTLA